MPPRYPIEDRSVPISSFIDGIVVKLLSGLKSLNVLKPDMFCIIGSYSSMLVTTTKKSITFHPSCK